MASPSSSRTSRFSAKFSVASGKKRAPGMRSASASASFALVADDAGDNPRRGPRTPRDRRPTMRAARDSRQRAVRRGAPPPPRSGSADARRPPRGSAATVALRHSWCRLRDRHCRHSIAPAPAPVTAQPRQTRNSLRSPAFLPTQRRPQGKLRSHETNSHSGRRCSRVSRARRPGGSASGFARCVEAAHRRAAFRRDRTRGDHHRRAQPVDLPASRDQRQRRHHRQPQGHGRRSLCRRGRGIDPHTPAAAPPRPDGIRRLRVDAAAHSSARRRQGPGELADDAATTPPARNRRSPTSRSAACKSSMAASSTTTSPASSTRR